LIFTLKTHLLNDKKRLVLISKGLSSVYKDKDYNKLPEKIIDIFKNYEIIFTPKTQKSFI